MHYNHGMHGDAVLDYYYYTRLSAMLLLVAYYCTTGCAIKFAPGRARQTQECNSAKIGKGFHDILVKRGVMKAKRN